MPVVTVHALEPPDPAARERCLEAVAAGVARAIGCEPDQVWVYWCAVDRAWVGGELRSFRGHCPVLTLRARQGRSADDIAGALEAAARAVADCLALPLEDVWAHWLELPAGQVFAGGAVR